MSFYIKLKRKRFGVEKVLHTLEGLFLNSKYLEGRFYQPWLGLSCHKREKFLLEVKRSIQVELLGVQFMRALATDVIEPETGEVHFESHVYKWMKTRVYKGDVRRLLGDLVEIMEGK